MHRGRNEAVKPPPGVPLNVAHPRWRNCRAWWDFIDANAGQAHERIHGPGGIFTGTFGSTLTVVGGKGGNAIYCDGSDNGHLTCGSHDYDDWLNKSFTLACRVYATALPGAGTVGCIYSKGEPAASGAYFAWYETGKPYMVCQTDADKATTSGEALSANVWYDICFVKYQLSLGRIYVNGIEPSSYDVQQLTGTVVTAAAKNTYIGKADINGHSWEGYIEYIGVWFRPFTALEAQELHQNPYAGYAR